MPSLPIALKQQWEGFEWETSGSPLHRTHQCAMVAHFLLTTSVYMSLILTHLLWHGKIIQMFDTVCNYNDMPAAILTPLLPSYQHYITSPSTAAWNVSTTVPTESSFYHSVLLVLHNKLRFVTLMINTNSDIIIQ